MISRIAATSLAIFGLFGFFMALCLPACQPGGTQQDEVVEFVLSGTVQYEDKEYTRYGLSPYTRYRPVRFAPVELLNATGKIVASGVTDAEGSYRLSGRAASNVTLRVVAITAAESGYQLEVKTLDDALISAVQALSLQAGSNLVNMNIGASGGAGGAFNILDVLTYALEYFRDYTGAESEPLSAFWNRGNTVVTHYCRIAQECINGPGIYILGGDTYGAGDTDEYDDDVLLHEFGHYSEDQLGTLDSRGGIHYLHELNQDLRLAWSEGWSNYTSGAVKQWIAGRYGQQVLSQSDIDTTSYGQYVDTANDVLLLSYDFSSGAALYSDSGNITPRYATNETSVAKVLWDLNADYAHDDIFNAVTPYLAGTNSTLEAFWRGWTSEQRDQSGVIDRAREILRMRSIYYERDEFETDDSIDAATTVLPGCEYRATLYSDSLPTDHDIFQLDAIANLGYTIETSNLLNGADTYLQILEPDGYTPLAGASNDNYDTVDYYPASLDASYPYEGSYLHSRVTFTSPGNSRYYIVVRPSARPPLWAGQLGDYTLMVHDSLGSASFCP